MNNIENILAQRKLDSSEHAQEIINDISTVTTSDVERAINNKPGVYSYEKMIILLSPAAKGCIEQIAQAAQKLTIQRFGRVLQMYAPLYVSNLCINGCKYCGFNCKTKFERTRLTVPQAIQDSDIIASEGFRNILIVAGEDPQYVTVEYLSQLAKQLCEKFSTISMEIQPMTTEQYQGCFDAGIDGVSVYQETYNRQSYEYYHPSGPKSDYSYRINTHDRTASAGMRRLGIGVLLGLNHWQIESLALAEHAHYLMKKYWQSQVSFSFPRIRPAENTIDVYKHLVSETDLVQMMCALRLCFADAGINLSTRESSPFRDNMTKICVTQISAGSKTNPGGYSEKEESLEQFVINDDRSAKDISDMLIANGYEPVWKDWDKAFSNDPATSGCDLSVNSFF